MPAAYGSSCLSDPKRVRHTCLRKGERHGLDAPRSEKHLPGNNPVLAFLTRTDFGSLLAPGWLLWPGVHPASEQESSGNYDYCQSYLRTAARLKRGLDRENTSKLWSKTRLTQS